MDGFEVDQDGTRKNVQTKVDKSRFVPHEDAYYERVLELIEDEMMRK
jgi:hypothetical protein